MTNNHITPWQYARKKEWEKEKSSILEKIRSGSGFTIEQLRTKYTEKDLYFIALQHVSTSNAAICEALEIPLKFWDTYMEYFKVNNLLMHSLDKHTCPLTKQPAHFITTNPHKVKMLKHIWVNHLRNNIINILEGGQNYE